MCEINDHLYLAVGAWGVNRIGRFSTTAQKAFEFASGHIAVVVRS